jgi:hypothetical protein
MPSEIAHEKQIVILNIEIPRRILPPQTHEKALKRASWSSSDDESSENEKPFSDQDLTGNRNRSDIRNNNNNNFNSNKSLRTNDPKDSMELYWIQQALLANSQYRDYVDEGKEEEEEDLYNTRDHDKINQDECEEQQNDKSQAEDEGKEEEEEDLSDHGFLQDNSDDEGGEEEEDPEQDENEYDYEAEEFGYDDYPCDYGDYTCTQDYDNYDSAFF